jgi:hypothetical protein
VLQKWKTHLIGIRITVTACIIHAPDVNPSRLSMETIDGSREVGRSLQALLQLTAYQDLRRIRKPCGVTRGYPTILSGDMRSIPNMVDAERQAGNHKSQKCGRARASSSQENSSQGSTETKSVNSSVLTIRCPL